MDEEKLLNYTSPSNSINNIPYSNFILPMLIKRKMINDLYNDNINDDENTGGGIYDRKRARKSLYENFELLKEQKLDEHDICIDHFKDMEKYTEKICELKNIYNFLFNNVNIDYNNYDILYVNKKFCTINCNNIIYNKNIFIDNFIYNLFNYHKIAKGHTQNDVIKYGKGNLYNVAHDVYNNKYVKKKKNIGRRYLNCISNQILYIDDLSRHDILLLISFFIQLQNEQKKNEKEEKNLENIANINEIKMNIYSLNDIYNYYYKEKVYQCFTCGLRFMTSMDKLNHLENHYKKSQFYLNNSERSSFTKSKKRFLYLDHINLPIEVFVCKNYSIFEDFYDNVVTKNMASFNFQGSHIEEQILDDNNDNDSYHNDDEKIYYEEGEKKKKDESKNNDSLYSYLHTKIHTHPNKDKNQESFLNNNTKNIQEKYNVYNMLSYNNNNNNNNDVANLFNFKKTYNNIDNFFHNKETIHNMINPNMAVDKNKKKRNILNDREKGSNEINFFDYIYGNENTYDVYLSNYYTVTEDNSVLINYINGPTMYRNIMKCLEIKDIYNYKFPSWIPKRSINNFFIKRIIEIDKDLIGIQKKTNIFTNILSGRTPSNTFPLNSYNIQDDLNINNNTNNNLKGKNKKKIDVINKNNLWNICTTHEFYNSKGLCPINVFLSYQKENTLDHQTEHSDKNDHDDKEESNNYPMQNSICTQESVENNHVLYSFLNIFNQKYFAQTDIFKNILLFHIRKHYFMIINELKDNIDFNELHSRLFQYIYNNYSKTISIFNINNYKIDTCFLCKENFSFEYSYEYNDFYYTNVICVDLKNVYENDDVEDTEEDANKNYDIDMSIKRIDHMCDEYVYNNNSYDIMDKCLYEKHKELNELLYENNKEMSDDAITQVELLNNKMVNNEINECSNHNNIKKVNNINTYDNININNIFTDIKKIIDDNCFLGNTIIESNMDCNFHMNIINKKNKKKDHIMNHYNNLFKNLCIPYDTLDILHRIKKGDITGKTNMTTNNFSNNTTNDEGYTNEEIDNFLKNYDNITNDIKNAVFQSTYHNRSPSKNKNSFNDIIMSYIYNDENKKKQHSNIFFPSKNYTYTNFTYFHIQCFKNYIEYNILPYYFLTKLNDKYFKNIILGAITDLYNSYKNICNKRNNRDLKISNVKKGQIHKRRHF
ncbi:hypothetical protein CYL21_2647 [Plasmodium falciparum NF54]|uniref:Zinc finger protein, putative n=2 Tax=Plasmodium falciparum TaxID=5833 RepID=Q8IKP5_PLAF7|nr:zinc finger protein, putative [Plasmodium falciparum 3D7]EWC86280.1 hypothetical protein PFNF54_05010 [Plasmodium falciparum NF54]KAF4329462.1 hypothetical protein CYL21_2647 [Plasmodium falciparum NF54]PKC49561.1 hypothetical protein CK202_0273 [Plasmodium falciparum NF54]CZU00282.1 zinc finger protein, putative [Plasmodium falciparum 3D7]|eukprot:XP_001348733.1 conserved Plasmodium protein, unknown function [Plasmodium falciparum 3D7]